MHFLGSIYLLVEVEFLKMSIMEDLLKEDNQFNVMIAVSIGVLLVVLFMDPLGIATKKDDTKTEKKVIDPKTKYTR